MIIDGKECVIRLRATEEVEVDDLDKEKVFGGGEELDEFLEARNSFFRGHRYFYPSKEEGSGDEILKIKDGNYVRNVPEAEGDFDSIKELNGFIAAHPGENWNARYWVRAKDGSDDEFPEACFWGWSDWAPLDEELQEGMVEEYLLAQGLKTMTFDGRKCALRVFIEDYDGALVAEKVFESFDEYKAYTDVEDPGVFTKYGKTYGHCSVVEVINGVPMRNPLSIFDDDFISMAGINDALDAKFIVKDYLDARQTLKEYCESLIDEGLLDDPWLCDSGDTITQLLVNLEVKGYRIEKAGRICWLDEPGIQFKERYSFETPLPEGLAFSRAFKWIAITESCELEVDEAFEALLAWSESLPEHIC